MITYKELKRLMKPHKEKLSALEEICRKTDGTRGSVCRSTEFNFCRDIPVFFFAFHDAVPVGFLSLFIPSEDEAEINALVHPNYRQQGIFTALLKRARAVLSTKGIGRLLFVCEPQAKASVSAMTAMHAVRVTFECQMSLSSPEASLLSSRFEQTPLPYEKQGVLLPVTEEDLPEIGRMNAILFNLDPDTGWLWAEDNFYNSDIRCYKYVLPAVEEPSRPAEQKKQTVPIGTVCFCEESSVCCIFGLGILPGYRGQGFGAHLLHSLLVLAPKNKRIVLHVSGQNAAAFSLYQKAGFEILHRQDYWLLQ